MPVLLALPPALRSASAQPADETPAPSEPDRSEQPADERSGEPDQPTPDDVPQSTKPPEALPAGLVQFVPPSAPIFLSVDRPQRLQRVLTATLTDEALQALLGGDAPTPLDLPVAMAELLGTAGAIPPEELLETPVALAAGSWSQLGRSVWLLQVGDESRLDAWFPPDKRRSEHQTEVAHFFRTGDDVAVCLRDGVMAVAKRSETEPLLRATITRMLGGRGAGLDKSAGYMALAKRLPQDPLALLYVSAVSEPVGGEAPYQPPLATGIESAALGLYQRDGWLELAVRARMGERRSAAALSWHAIDTMQKLPLTTSAAWAGTMDWRGLYEATQTGPAHNRAELYAAALLRVLESRGGPGATGLVERLGREVIVVWDEGDGLRPELAVLLECSDPDALRETLVQAASGVLRVVGMRKGGPGLVEPLVGRRTHLGVEIVDLPLSPILGPEVPDAFAPLGEVKLTFAARDGWVIAALSTGHVERIVESSLGLAPALGSAVPLDRVQAGRQALSSVVAAQPSLAAGVLEAWAAHLTHHEGEWMALSWWRELTEARPRLGIGVRAKQERGVSIVARVDAGSAADGKLHVGDRIVSVDGAVLDLEAPNADLRARLEEAVDRGQMLLRVQRGREMLDVEVAIAAAAGEPADPIESLRRLAAALRPISDLSVGIQASETHVLAAQAAVRLQPPP